MKRALKHLHLGLWITIAAVLSVIAIIFSTAHLATPYIQEQRPLIERWASNYLQQPVQIGSLAIDWEGFTPVIKCTHAIIFDDQKQNPLLTVDELDFGINVLESLFTGGLKFDGIALSGANITVHQKQDGSLELNGLKTIFPPAPALNEGENLTAFMEWLFSSPRLTINNVTLNWHDKNSLLYPIRGLYFNIHNYGHHHILWGQAALAQATPSEFKFVVHLRGSWAEKDNLKARFYFFGQNVVLQQWLQNHAFHDFSVKKGLSNFQIWGFWKQNALQNLHALIGLKDVVAYKANAVEPIMIQQGNSNIFWQKHNSSWDLDASFNHLIFSRWKNIPGVNNAAGFISFTPNLGEAVLNSSDVAIDFGPLFRAPLFFTKLSSKLNWQQNSDGWLIQAKEFNLQTVDAALNGKMQLLLPTDSSSPVLGLLASFKMLGKQHLADYLPLTVLSPGLVHWLETAITSSASVESTFVLNGPLHAFPFEQHEGTFIVDSYVKGLSLKYQPNWPAINNISGRLVFADRSMEMNIDSAILFNTPVQNIHVAIPEIKKDVPTLLQIDGNVATNINDTLEFLQQSPLKKGMLNTLASMEGTGPLQLNLHLVIPLEHNKISTTASGQINLQNVNLTIPSHNLQLTNLQGQLTFTQDSLNARNIAGKLWGKPIVLNISKQQGVPQIQAKYADFMAILAPGKNAWNLNLQSPNMQGQIVVPNGKQQTLQATFQRLYLTSDTDQNLSKIKPTDLPPVDFSADDFRYNDKQFGQVKFKLLPIAKGVQISSLNAVSSAYSLAAKGSWTFESGRNLTQLDGTIMSNNIASALQSFGFSASNISASQTQLNFNLMWPGAAYDPSLKSMVGNLVLQMQQGQVTNLGSETEMKMNIGRVLSFLSFQSLERRLRLDFSDLTSRGFSFDSVKATIKLQEGNAYTQDAFISGPVAHVSISGRIGLVTKDYDLQVNVTPEVTSALPLIVGLATGPVGPIAGAATWVASKVLSSAVDKITTDSYRMTGSWSNPNVVQSGSNGSVGKR